MTQMYSILDSRLPIITYDQQVLILKFKLKTSSAYKPTIVPMKKPYWNWIPQLTLQIKDCNMD